MACDRDYLSQTSIYGGIFVFSVSLVRHTSIVSGYGFASKNKHTNIFNNSTIPYMPLERFLYKKKLKVLLSKPIKIHCINRNGTAIFAMIAPAFAKHLAVLLDIVCDFRFLQELLFLVHEINTVLSLYNV